MKTMEKSIFLNHETILSIFYFRIRFGHIAHQQRKI